jgi:hypothetical protein
MAERKKRHKGKRETWKRQKRDIKERDIYMEEGEKRHKGERETYMTE